ncbi:MAG: acylphosphatase, partial [Candidatus Obscuribacter sp.]|nr:acylphosphatase [Candidatus Obscuribacter sp.]
MSLLRDNAIKSLISGRLIRIKGTVQGVGFRPTVYGEALKHSITGHILNDGEGVLIKAFGAEAD